MQVIVKRPFNFKRATDTESLLFGGRLNLFDFGHTEGHTC